MHRFHPSRREFLKTTAVVGAATFAVPGFVNADGHSVVRIRARTDIRSLDTARGITTADYDVRHAILNNLILYKAGDVYTWTHDAAEHIEQVDPLHTEFRLRPGIMWTNGYGEMTAEDVKYSYERMKSPELEATDRQEYEHLQEVKVIDKYSGVLIMKQPVANLWTNTLPRGMGVSHLQEGVGGAERLDHAARQQSPLHERTLQDQGLAAADQGGARSQRALERSQAPLRSGRVRGDRGRQPRPRSPISRASWTSAGRRWARAPSSRTIRRRTPTS